MHAGASATYPHEAKLWTFDCRRHFEIDQTRRKPIQIVARPGRFPHTPELIELLAIEWTLWVGRTVERSANQNQNDESPRLS